MQSNSAEVDGVLMRWEEEGSGEPVVFVHGIPTSPRLWRHVIPEVRGARSLEWETVDYGGSIEEGVDRGISVGRIISLRGCAGTGSKTEPW